MPPLGMQPSDIRSSAWFGANCGLVCFIFINQYWSSSVKRRARRDERSSAPSVRRERPLLYVPAEHYFLSLFYSWKDYMNMEQRCQAVFG
jgi:hypothetical protein